MSTQYKNQKQNITIDESNVDYLLQLEALLEKYTVQASLVTEYMKTVEKVAMELGLFDE